MSAPFPYNLGGLNNGTTRSNQVIGRSIYGLGPMFDISSTQDSIVASVKSSTNTALSYILGATGSPAITPPPYADPERSTATTDAGDAFQLSIYGLVQSVTFQQLMGNYRNYLSALAIAIIKVLLDLGQIPAGAYPSAYARALAAVAAFNTGTSTDPNVNPLYPMNGLINLLDPLENAILARDTSAADAARIVILVYATTNVLLTTAMPTYLVNFLGLDSVTYLPWIVSLVTAAASGLSSNLTQFVNLASQQP